MPRVTTSDRKQRPILGASRVDVPRKYSIVSINEWQVFAILRAKVPRQSLRRSRQREIETFSAARPRTRLHCVASAVLTAHSAAPQKDNSTRIHPSASIWPAPDSCLNPASVGLVNAMCSQMGALIVKMSDPMRIEPATVLKLLLINSILPLRASRSTHSVPW